MTWAYHQISTIMSACGAIDVVHLNDDSLYDVLVADFTAGAVYTFTCNDLAAGSWTRKILAYPLPGASNVMGRDFDADGDVDVVTMGKIPGLLTLHEDRGDSWEETDLQIDFLGGWALASGDMNGDGDLDFLAGASALGDLYLYENTSAISDTGPPPVIGELQLAQNQPNPFNPSTTIGFSLATAQAAEITVYSVAGHKVSTLLDEHLPAGPHKVVWDGRDQSGHPFGSGAYFYRLRTGGRVKTKRMLLLK